jgi:hypothetical protein
LKRRIVRKLQREFGYELSPLYPGGLYSPWRGTPFSEAKHLRDKDAMGNITHDTISDFKDEWKGGSIIFPASAKEAIFERFKETLLDSLFESVAIVMNSLLYFTGKIGIEDHALVSETQAFNFGFFMNRDWRDPITRTRFNEDSVCLGIAGIAYEFLCVVAAELLRIFDQPVALLRRGVSNVPDVLRLTKKT